MRIPSIVPASKKAARFDAQYRRYDNFFLSVCVYHNPLRSAHCTSDFLHISHCFGAALWALATNLGHSSLEPRMSGYPKTRHSGLACLPVCSAPLVAVQEEISVSWKRSFVQVQALEKQTVGRRPFLVVADDQYGPWKPTAGQQHMEEQ